MKACINFLMAVALLVIVSANAEGKNKNIDTGYKVVFQLSSNDSLVYKSFVRQLNNLLTAMPGVTIEVVTHGPGVEFLFAGSKYENAILQLKNKGITFLVCQNTLKEKKIDPKVFLSAVEIIPAGIAHVIRRQSESWSYIKVGF